MDVMTNPNTAPMTNQGKRICAHISCLCIVPDGEEYCGPACQDGGSGDVDIACQCHHIACSLMIRPFRARTADLQGL